MWTRVEYHDYKNAEAEIRFIGRCKSTSAGPPDSEVGGSSLRRFTKLLRKVSELSAVCRAWTLSPGVRAQKRVTDAEGGEALKASALRRGGRCAYLLSQTSLRRTDLVVASTGGKACVEKPCAVKSEGAGAKTCIR